MTTIIELKEIAKRIYARFATYIIPAAKFLVELVALLLIRKAFGYEDRVSSVPLCLLLSLAAAFLPLGISALIPAIVILFNFYALSTEVFLAGGAIMMIVALLYLRFSPKTGYMVVLAPVLFACHIPFILPVAAGLLFGPGAAISIACGAFLFYFFQGISANAAAFSGGEESTALEKISTLIKQITGNREMLLVILVFILTTIVVYAIRRMSINHAWTIAIIAGFMVEFVILLGGFIALGLSEKIGFLVLGNVLSVAIALVIKLFCFNVDYKRTERTQFEDDDYYYYVKAVPKLQMEPEEKKVRKYSTTRKTRQQSGGKA